MSDLLDTFLSIATSALNESSPKKLQETDIFNKETNESVKIQNDDKNLIHNGETDSSDDEDNKYYQDRKYNESGKDIKYILKTSQPSTSSSSSFQEKTNNTWKTKPNIQLTPKPNTTVKPQDVYTDPIFGLRIINPLVSSTTLQERMTGRDPVAFANLKRFLTGNLSDKNWVLAGVIVGKSAVKTSQKGNQFSIWTLSDLKNDIKTVSLFLFGGAHKQLWKTATGVVVGVLNPTLLEKKDNSKDEACLSIDNAQKVMILGQSKDLGKCKSVKKNGEQCNAIVNINRCEFCVYHIKQEYQKCSRRSELQSSFAGQGLTALRNKVLGKNEVFYAGKSYTAIPAKRSKKLEARDDGILQALSGGFPAKIATKKPKTIKSAASNLEVTQRQRLKDLTLLEKLGQTKTDFKASHSSEPTLESSKKTVAEVLTKLKENQDKTDNLITPENNLSDNKTPDRPKLPKKSQTFKRDTLAAMDFPLLTGSDKGVIDLNEGISKRNINKSKLNALKYIQRNGPLKKSDPNSTKANVKKRHLDTPTENTPKKLKIENELISDRFKKIMAATSKHTDLLEDYDQEEQDKYFYKLEKKEQMEEKMINTYKVPCKAVRCLQCKYTNFSASQFCKDNKHKLKVFDAMKRFYKCGDCSNRTVTLEVVPTVACKNCGSGKWERTGMMKEKTIEVQHNLSIRGGEQKFVNSVASNANLDLLVPDD